LKGEIKALAAIILISYLLSVNTFLNECFSGTCINGSWRKFDQALKHDAEKKKLADEGEPKPQPAPPVPEAPKEPEVAAAPGLPGPDAHDKQQQP
jgi:hypothetical protein